MVGIVTIDRDINYAQILLNSIIQNGIDMKDIYVCTRETDTKIIEFWKPIVNVITINHYDILNRHNMNKIANKRQILLDIANDKKYDYIWFIDSDIIPTKNILNKLLKIKSNVAIAPYPIKWMVDKSAVVGIKNEKIFICKNSGKIIRCTIGGMGCTLIHKSCFDIPFIVGKIVKNNFEYEGEDIGWFKQANKRHKQIYCLDIIQQHFI